MKTHGVRNRDKRSGFTLVEMLMAVSISVLVFAAMGSVLVYSVRIWVEGAGQWHLANQARATRARLLSGAMGPGSGLLSLEEITQLQTNPQWCIFRYKVAGGPHNERYTLRGSVYETDRANRALFIQRNPGGGSNWLMMGLTKRGSHGIPEIIVSNFQIVHTNRQLDVTYTLSFETGGKWYSYPQRVRPFLVNYRE